MNQYLWCAFVNLLADEWNPPDAKEYILSCVAGDDDAKTEAGVQIDNALTACYVMAAIDPYERSDWYLLDSPLQTLGTFVT